MYKDNSQMRIEDFVFPYGKLDREADKIYRSRQTLSFCKEHGIRLSGPALGKPPKNQNLTRQLKNQEYHDSCDRNAVEGAFGTCAASSPSWFRLK